MPLAAFAVHHNARLQARSVGLVPVPSAEHFRQIAVHPCVSESGHVLQTQPDPEARVGRHAPQQVMDEAVIRLPDGGQMTGGQVVAFLFGLHPAICREGGQVEAVVGGWVVVPTAVVCAHTAWH